MTTMRISFVFFLIILFNIGLIFAYSAQDDIYISSKTYEDDVFNDTLPDAIVPRNYDIILKLDYDNTFHGTISILIEVIQTTTNISFHILNLSVDYGDIRLVRKENSGDISYGLKGQKYDTEKHILTLLCDKKLSPGYYTLNMKYVGATDDNFGFVQIGYDKWINEQMSYITMLEPNGARSVFPCWDEPRFKATFNISVDHPLRYKAFSNMQQHTITLFTDGYQIRTNFKRTPLIPTYLVIIGLLNSMYGNVTNERIWFSKQASEATRNRLERGVRRIDNYLMNYTNNHWNNLVNVIAFPELPKTVVGGLECAVFRDTDVTYDRELDFISRGRDVWKVITYGLVRQYIETIVSPTQWSHMWLNKALELHISYNFLKEYFNMEWTTNLYTVQVLQPALHDDIAFSMPPVIHKFDPIYSSFIYRKAFALINMLERIITKDVLKQAIVEYLNTYAYSSATPDDFFNIVNKIVLQLKGELPYDIKEIMTTWLSNRKYPTLLVTRNYDTNSTTISYNNHPNVDWVIPVTYIRQKYPSFHDIPILWSNNISSRHYNSIELPKINNDEWILLNERRFGYYRVNYDNENWLKIGRFLANNELWKINVLTRSQIIDDAYHFLMEDKMSLSTYLTLIAYLSKETDYIVWHSMMNTLTYMSLFFEYPESESFKNFILNIINNVLEIVPAESDEHNMQQAMRLLLLNWACKHGDQMCRQTANEKLAVQLTNSKKYPTEWMNWIFCAGVMNTNKSIWKIVEYNFIHGNDFKNIHHLACNENEDTITELLKSITFESGNKWLQATSAHLRKLYDAILKKHARKNKVLDFILENFDRIFPSYMTKVEKLGNVIMSLYSQNQLEKIRKYVQDLSWDYERMVIKRLIAFRWHQINYQKKMFVRFSNVIKEG